MVRPRFAKLPAAQQQAILQAASDEFATRGFHDASLNRVIEAAGISKGSLYYYFDGKEDVYAYVAQIGLERLFADLGPFTVPTADDADAFWSTVEAYYLQVMTALIASPQLAALIRGWVATASSPALQRAQQEAELAIMPWMEQTIAAGRRAGAVRGDLPSPLLIAVVSGMGQAMDTWLLSRPDEDDLPNLIRSLVGMIRRALQP